MELRHLRYFIAVAEAGSFTHAAKRLHTAQPSLSSQIRDLEREIGTLLFERSGRKVELTEAGGVFLAEARLTMAQADRSIARARHVGLRRQKTIVIGFVPAAEIRIFPTILPRLRMQFPDLDIELRSMPTVAQEEALLRDDIDVAFMRDPVHSKELVSEVVLTEPLLVLLPATHPLAKLDRIPPEKLNGEAFVSTDRQFAGRVHDVVENYFIKHGLQRNVTQVATNILLNLNLVGMGLGYAMLPAYVAALTNDSICCRPLDGEPPYIDLLMVCRAGPRSPELSALIQLGHHTSISVQDINRFFVLKPKTREPAS